MQAGVNIVDEMVADVLVPIENIAIAGDSGIVGLTWIGAG